MVAAVHLGVWWWCVLVVTIVDHTCSLVKKKNLLKKELTWGLRRVYVSTPHCCCCYCCWWPQPLAVEGGGRERERGWNLWQRIFKINIDHVICWGWARRTLTKKKKSTMWLLDDQPQPRPFQPQCPSSWQQQQQQQWQWQWPWQRPRWPLQMKTMDWIGRWMEMAGPKRDGNREHKTVCFFFFFYF